MGLDIFVFGSNEAGRHGRGAAFYAVRNHGAIYGQGRGRTGSSYALPTKDEQLRSVSIEALRRNVAEFIEHAEGHQDDRFILTPVGCGLAGFDARTVAGMFWGNLPSNVVLHQSWLEHIAGGAL